MTQPTVAPNTHIDFVSRPTTSDYVWNAMAVTRSSLVTIAVGTFATATAVVTGILTGDRVLNLPLLAGLLLAGLSLLTGLFVVPFIWWPIHERRDLVLAPVHFVADEEGISLATETSTARHEWSVFRRIRETPGAFVLDTGANVGILVPKRGIAEPEIGRLRSLFVAAGTMTAEPSGLERWRPLLGVALGLIATLVAFGAPMVLGSP